MTYYEFINNIRLIRENTYFKYSERHHIIPRCLGGTDDEDNLIYLTYREHFIAHKMLAEENPEDEKLVYAYWRMCHSHQSTECTPEEYEEAKILVSNMMTGRKLPDSTKEKMKLSAKNRPPVSEETKRKLSMRPVSEETRIKLSLANKGKKLSLEHRGAISESRRGIWSGDLNPKHINPPIGELNSFYGKHHTEETRKKISDARKNYAGENHPLYGKHHTEETKRKISKSLSGREVSEETKIKLREAAKNKVYYKVCNICGSEFNARSSRSKYCDACKLKRDSKTQHEL